MFLIEKLISGQSKKKKILFLLSLLVLFLFFRLNVIQNSSDHSSPYLRSGEISYTFVFLANISFIVFMVFLALFVSGFLQRLIVPKAPEQYLSDLLQFLNVEEDNKTIRTKDNQLFQTIYLEGIDCTSFTTEEVIYLFEKRCSFLSGLLGEGISYRIITSREIISERDSFIFNNKILQKIHSIWNEQFARAFQNKYYLVFHVNGKEKNALMSLNRIVEKVMGHFDRYSPQILTNQPSDRQKFSPLLSFWSKIVNRFDFEQVSHSKDLSFLLSQSYIEFNQESGLITYRDGQSEIFEKIMMVKFWGEKDYPAFLLDLLKLDGELFIGHFVKGIKQDKAVSYLGRGKSFSISLNGTANKEAEFDHVIDAIKNEEVSLVKHQMSVYLRAKTQDDLNELCNQARKVLVSYGMSPVIAQDGLRMVWLSQFPGYDNLLRPRTPITKNISNFMHFDKFCTGLQKSDWGQGPIRQFKTIAGNSYAFQFHVSDAKESTGHCVVFAPTEGGKTTLMQHLIGGAMRHEDLKVFAFDKLNGMSIFTRALGGNHIHFGEEKESVSLNPFHYQDSASYRAFLFRWLCDLTQIDPEDTESREQVNWLIDSAFNLKNFSDRSLTKMCQKVIVKNNHFHTRIKEWSGERIGSRWFNGETDILDFSKSNLVTFDMTDILEDEVVAGPVINYIMYRIRSYCQQAAVPHLVFIDETKRYIANDLFKKDLMTLLEEHRKLRGVICLAFQNSQSIGDKQFQESVLNQCKTRIIFPNPNAKREEYHSLDLSDGEFSFVKGESDIAKKMKRGVLVKRPNESVILDVDLLTLGSYLNLYKSGSEPVKLVDDLYKKWGDQWIVKYLKD